MSFINEATPAAVQHRNWNWKLGQTASAPVPPAVAFIVVPGTQLGSKYSTGGLVYTLNDLDPDNGSGSNSWRGGSYGAGAFVAFGTNSMKSLDGITWGDITALPFAPWSISVAGPSNCSTYNRTAGLWLYSGGGTSSVGYSADALSWTAFNFAPKSAYGVATCQNLGRFYVALGQDGGAYSTDGSAWTFLAPAVFSGTNINIVGFCSGASVGVVYAFGSRDVTFPGPFTDQRMCVWRSTDGATFSLVYTDPTGANGFTQQLTEGAVSDDGVNVFMQGFDSSGGGLNIRLYSDDSGSTFTRATAGASTLANKLISPAYCAGNFYATRTNGAVFRGVSGGVIAQVETSLPFFATSQGGPICNY